jgi:hypothetical protein
MDNNYRCGNAEPYDYTEQAIKCSKTGELCAYQRYCGTLNRVINSDYCTACLKFKESENYVSKQDEPV